MGYHDLRAQAVEALRKTWARISKADTNCWKPIKDKSGWEDDAAVMDAVTDRGLLFPAWYGDNQDAVAWWWCMGEEERESMLREAFPRGYYGFGDLAGQYEEDDPNA